MVFRYVPVLRWKRGERVGLQHLSPAARHDVLPLFIRGGDKYVGKKATKSRPASAPADVFASDVAAIWGNAPFYLDASALPVGTAGHHPLIDMAVSARSKGLSLIPATRLDAPLPYQQAVAALVQQDNRGVALRVDLQELTAAATWAPSWPHPLADTDLLIDFANSVGTVAALGSALDPALVSLHGAGQWRTVTILGSSMPENFNGYQAGLHTIPRVGVALWQRLSGIGLSYRLDYGDYTTVATTPPPQGIKWGYPINARYTLRDQFLICRGIKTTGLGGVDMDQQLIGHARNLVRYAGRSPLAHCWGDSKIDRIAAGIDDPQGLEHWVQIAVNRHIELTRAHLP